MSLGVDEILQHAGEVGNQQESCTVATVASFMHTSRGAGAFGGSSLKLEEKGVAAVSTSPLGTWLWVQIPALPPHLGQVCLTNHSQPQFPHL